jgi:uncharacterized membrane protein YoaK (UPF0700 family)
MSYAAGAGDTFAFAQLGGVFTANMTGSLVLAGLTARPAYGDLLSGAAIALVAFLIAVYTASRATPVPTAAHWNRITWVLWTVAGLNLALFVAIAATPDPGPGSALRLVLLAVSAAAMGAQTTAAKRYEHASGVTTTFVTGTLTSLVQDAADGSGKHAPIRVVVVVMLVLGALTASGAMALDLRLGPAVAAVATAVAALVFPTDGSQTA